jgi:hypothetical protein
MHILARRLVAVGVLAGGAVAAVAGEPAVPIKPFLDCAGSQAYHLYFLKSSGYDKADALKEVEDKIQFYLQIAESLSQRTLRQEFLEASESEKQNAEKVIKAGGSNAYLAYDADRQAQCASLVKNHQKEIMKAVDKLYEDQGKR